MVEVVVNQKPMPQNPIDPNVVIPESVKRRAAAVDAFYAEQSKKAAENGAQVAPSPPVSPVPEQLPLPMEMAPAAQVSGDVPPSPAPVPEDENSLTWKHQALTWQGRYNATQKTIAEMQEQMNQLGGELIRAQQITSRPEIPSSVQPAITQNYLTEKDVQEYGTDLVDFTQRAAVQAVAPHLQAITQQNAYLQERLAKEARRGLDQRVELAVPNYREIDRNPRWHRWLLGVDVLSGRVRQTLLNEAISSSVRQTLLNEAIAAAEAPRVISFFRGFLQEEQATGHLEPALNSQQPAAPREAAIPLASLAAPGRARPAGGGDTSLPPEKPVYTRTQLRQLYEMHRRGAYAGREAEWARLDADIIAAGREGRVLHQ
jgi:hypothetical protein